MSGKPKKQTTTIQMEMVVERLDWSDIDEDGRRQYQCEYVAADVVCKGPCAPEPHRHSGHVTAIWDERSRELGAPQTGQRWRVTFEPLD
jgi:hypothetical protein